MGDKIKNDLIFSRPSISRNTNTKFSHINDGTTLYFRVKFFLKRFKITTKIEVAVA